MPWETVGHEIRHRVRDPEDFQEDTFRTKKVEGVKGEGITELMADNVYMVLGKLKEDVAKAEDRDPNSMVLQSIRFRIEIEKDSEWVKTGWTIEKAKKWWNEHKDSFESKSKLPLSIERRAFMASFRKDSEKPRQIVGHAAVFDTITDLGWFKERIAKGAFAESIKCDDIRALFNHDPNIVLGRNTAGTLRLGEDEKGLAVEIDLPDTQWARDLIVSMEREDITQMSFGFEVLDASWDTVDREDVRTLKRVKLWDVSPVTFPAYPTTDASVRSAWEIYNEHRLQRGNPAAIDPTAGRQGPEGRQVPLDILRRKLEIKMKEV